MHLSTIFTHALVFACGAYALLTVDYIRFKLRSKAQTFGQKKTKKSSSRFSTGDIIVRYTEKREDWEEVRVYTSLVLDVGKKNYRLASWFDSPYGKAEFTEGWGDTVSIRFTDMTHHLETQQEKELRETKALLKRK